MEEKKSEKDVIDLKKVIMTIWTKKKVFFIEWPIVFILSCIWILPQPRFYTSEVSLAPEATGEALGGGLASLASSFGFDLGSGGTDAIYPSLYPDLMSSNEFIVDLFKVQVTTEDKSLSTDYYTYLRKHQKKNWLTKPFKDLSRKITGLFVPAKKGAASSSELNPFMLSEPDFKLTGKVRDYITCNVDKKNDVITISVKDQDRVICATLADSVSQLLQRYITAYRTKKARIDASHYKTLTDSAQVEYDKAVKAYSTFCDSYHGNLTQVYQSERDRLHNELDMRLNTYNVMKTQYEAMLARVQERTPAFTTLQGATVPIKPSEPKRVLFVLGMLILSTFVTVLWVARKEIIK